ncbi:hypothetical protein UFOVP1299_46 [uncultured Caudovirales phage]|uniref:Uncharacterized protein n=1 Tax=uncultured Caudovirales phage TaxID=2100421 RepID=A0A6J5RNU7_9CAUD|nr:hypothetical protein UFOVP1299_46 [uncultured Caudovirales phage]
MAIAWHCARLNAFAYHDPKRMPSLSEVLGDTKAENPPAKGIDEEAIRSAFSAYMGKE